MAYYEANIKTNDEKDYKKVIIRTPYPMSMGLVKKRLNIEIIAGHPKYMNIVDFREAKNTMEVKR